MQLCTYPLHNCKDDPADENDSYLIKNLKGKISFFFLLIFALPFWIPYSKYVLCIKSAILTSGLVEWKIKLFFADFFQFTGPSVGPPNIIAFNVSCSVSRVLLRLSPFLSKQKAIISTWKRSCFLITHGEI